MDADPATLLEWLGCGERELQQTALEYLCNDILFSAKKVLNKYDITKFIRGMMLIFSDDMAPDELLEINARTLTYCLELAEVSMQTIGLQDYRVICMRLDTIDMSSYHSSEVGQQIIKVSVTFISIFRQTFLLLLSDLFTCSCWIWLLRSIQPAYTGVVCLQVFFVLWNFIRKTFMLTYCRPG